MLFNSFDFIWFFLAVYALYVILAHRAQNALLLVASYAFYAAWDARFLSLIALSTVVDFFCGRKIGQSNSQRTRRRLVTVSATVNLGLLGFFKYFNFFVDSAQAGLARLGYDVSPLHLDIVLPVGISFYTFQTMSYAIDVYRKKIEPARDFLDFAVYVAFFPQLVAGPIERAHRLLGQVTQPRDISKSHIQTGLWMIVYGYFKKVVLADNMAPLVAAAFDDPGSASPLTALTGVYAFALQIYGDFSGYSLIARGLAALMGFDLMQNFRMPYFATNPSDFWRRWHISLSTWLRDYLYIPLGGNRRGRGRTHVNLATTMLLGGLWHGAAWSFVAWGAFHGALLIGHRLLTPILARIQPTRSYAAAAWRAVRMLGFFHLVCLGWVLFRIEDLGDVWTLVSRAVEGFSFAHTITRDTLVVWGSVFTLLLPVDQPHTATYFCLQSRGNLIPGRAIVIAVLFTRSRSECAYLCILRDGCVSFLVREFRED